MKYDAVKLMKEAEDTYRNTCCKVAMIQNGRKCPVCNTNLPYVTLGSELRLGDVVETSNTAEPYSHATVKTIEAGKITLIRPYVQTSDFTYTGGVIPYLGWEEYTIFDVSPVRVIRESHVPEVIEHETDEGRLLRSGVAERRRRKKVRK